jgi:hypothetical protein
MANPRPPNYTARPGEAIRVSRTANGDFAIGAGRMSIAAADMRFVTDVVGALGRIVHTAAGEAAIREGDALGRRVVIVKPHPPTEPRNAWILPDDLAAATAAGLAIADGAGGRTGRGTGSGTGSTIVYDPADWPGRGDQRSASSETVLVLLLRQANRNAAGKSDPGMLDWGEGG